MKVVIFAGGFGTRLMEETTLLPKPMVEIGGKPILWHIMKYYCSYGYNDFIICLGYKGDVIKKYFLDYYLQNSDLLVDISTNQVEILKSREDTMKITLVDTGLNTNTAGRLKRIENYLNKDESFMLTYGDGVSDVDICELIKFHKKNNKLATLTSVQNPGRFGNIEMDANGLVRNFEEKPNGDGSWINGGFFVLEKGIFQYLEGDMDNVQWEKGPLVKIANDGQLSAFNHYGFWKCMDALRDRVELEEIWNNRTAKWKKW
jgi:glucose-1-phosphate cytidylyltransferase